MQLKIKLHGEIMGEEREWRLEIEVGGEGKEDLI
jgi:hypothetical protein